MHRVLVTLIGIAVATGLMFIPAPMAGFEEGELFELMPMLSIGTLGVVPLCTGAVLVELVTLIVPAWRSRRTGGRQARRPIRAAGLVVGLLLAAMQAYFLWGFTEVVMLEGGGGVWALLEFMLALVGATATLAVVVELVSRRGMGNGYSVVLAATALYYGALSVYDFAVNPQNSARWVMIVAITIGLSWVTSRVLGRTLARSEEGPPVLVQAPASGLHPLGDAALVYYVLSFGFIAIPGLFVADPATPLLDAKHYWDVFVPAVLISSAAYSAAFYRVHKVAEAWMAYETRRNGTAPSLTAIMRLVTRARWRALTWTVGLVFAIGVADAYFQGEVPGLVAVGVVVVTAVARDLVGAWRFERRHGPVCSVNEVHRLYLLPIILEELAEEGIPAYPRSLCHRTLGQFFAPFIPVEILVPEAHAELAAEIVEDALAPPA